MQYIECTTQAEVDAVKSPDVAIVRAGKFTACDSSQVTAYGSSQVTAYDSSQVTAYGSSQVTAYGSSQVTAYDSSQVRAYGSSQVTASKYVAVTKSGKSVKVTGGKQIAIPEITTLKMWLDFHGVEVKKGVAILYKAVRTGYKSSYDFDYTPGTVPVAPDWDGGVLECGKGLHFCARPIECLKFDSQASVYLGCPVRVKDIAFPKNAAHPNKVKAKGCCAPVWECDIAGNPVKAVV